MDSSKIYIIDIESNGLLGDMIDFKSLPYKLNDRARLWCVSIRNLGTGNVVTAVQGGITKEWMQEQLKDAEVLVAHNGLKFDFPALMLFGVFDYRIGFLEEEDTLFGKPIRFIDTLALSRFIKPDRYSGHSLAAWGVRVANFKIGFREGCIEKGIISAKDPKGAEFLQFCEDMVVYCEGDTSTTADVFKALLLESKEFGVSTQSFKLEQKLADLAIRRELFGFSFDKDLAVKNVNFLSEQMVKLEESILPNIPLKPMTKKEASFYSAPALQLKKDATPTANLIKFADRVGAELFERHGFYGLRYKEKEYKIPLKAPLETMCDPKLKDLDHIKMQLMALGWRPTEWRKRDLTKDSKKQSIPFEKRVKAFEKWFQETSAGKYKEARFAQFDMDPDDLYESILERLQKDFPVWVPTSPSLRTGVEKDLCPNLTKLGEVVSFAKDYALYLTYKHRRSNIAGGDIEDMDFDLEYPNTGYLSNYREEDGRIPTPSIEMGAASHRYRHIAVCNVPRPSSVFGEEMRSMFGCGKGFVQLGFDYSSLENRVQAGFIRKYPGGIEMGVSLTAEKPNDFHSLNAIKLNIPRGDAKSIGYGLIYGASAGKVAEMLGLTKEGGKLLYDEFWEAVAPLKMLRDDLLKEYEAGGSLCIKSIDGRTMFVRSPHSILNLLFQSTGVICAKYTSVFLMEGLEKQGLIIDPFIGKPDCTSMIEYHDEQQLACNPSLFTFETFDSEAEAEEFVSSYDGDGILSTIGHGHKFYVVLPNTISTEIEKAAKRTQELLSLEFELGFEWTVGRNWKDCH